MPQFYMWTLRILLAGFNGSVKDPGIFVIISEKGLTRMLMERDFFQRRANQVLFNQFLQPLTVGGGDVTVEVIMSLRVYLFVVFIGSVAGFCATL